MKYKDKLGQKDARSPVESAIRFRHLASDRNNTPHPRIRSATYPYHPHPSIDRYSRSVFSSVNQPLSPFLSVLLSPSFLDRRATIRLYL